MLVLRRCWWDRVDHDVTRWVDRCLTCIKFRKIAQKAPSPEAVPITAECWEEVMIDLEGPWSPATKSGNRYSMTYICCLCHGLLLEHAPKANAAEARRMFASCMFRSGTIPTLARSDRGPELKNAICESTPPLRYGPPIRRTLAPYGAGTRRECP